MLRQRKINGSNLPTEATSIPLVSKPNQKVTNMSIEVYTLICHLLVQNSKYNRLEFKINITIDYDCFNRIHCYNLKVKHRAFNFLG